MNDRYIKSLDRYWKEEMVDGVYSIIFPSLLEELVNYEPENFEPIEDLMKEKALFLDLDGTLIRTKSGSKYPENIDDWEFMSRKVLIAIKKYKEEGFHICIVANDGGIELGHYSKEQITTKLDCISKELEQYIGQTVNYAFCGNMESYMRKPNPGMAYRFALELELNLRNSVMVGNSETDAKFAKNAFIGTYLDVEDFMKEQFVREYSTPDTRPKQK